MSKLNITDWEDELPSLLNSKVGMIEVAPNILPLLTKALPEAQR
ncbi:MAG: hypothetical protein AAF992_11775 [Bacteroidota bacterium]